jgi:hypothetical protein
MAQEWVKHPISSSIRARVMVGVDPMTGEPTMANRNFNNVKPDASVNDVANTLEELMSLQKHSTQTLEQTDRSDFTHAF